MQNEYEEGVCMPTDSQPLAEQPSNGVETVPEPLPTPPVRPRRPGHRLRGALRRALLLLIVPVVLAASSDQSVLQQALTGRPPDERHATGAFVGPPLNATQIDGIRHLVSRMPSTQLARLYVSRMTLDEEIGQVMMAEYYDPQYSSELEDMITRLHVGGVVMYALQMHTFRQTKGDIARMQLHARLPLLISADEEGGFVERIQNIFGHRPGALETYQTGQPEHAARLGHSIAHDLRSLGINTDLAPDVDVQVVNGPNQYLRTWGYTAQSVITYGGAYLRALQGDGVIGCLKHFPGMGAAKTDAHFSLPTINRTRAQIDATELAPFKYFIQSQNRRENPGMIMATDILVPALDPTWPAELSPTFITGILRHQLGYDGVVITDALYTEGISKRWDLGEAAVLALNAGNDMLLGANGLYQMTVIINAVKAAVQRGRLSKARLDEAVTRVIALKLRYHLLPAVSPQDYLSPEAE